MSIEETRRELREAEAKLANLKEKEGLILALLGKNIWDRPTLERLSLPQLRSLAEEEKDRPASEPPEILFVPLRNTLPSSEMADTEVKVGKGKNKAEKRAAKQKTKEERAPKIAAGLRAALGARAEEDALTRTREAGSLVEAEWRREGGGLMAKLRRRRGKMKEKETSNGARKDEKEGSEKAKKGGGERAQTYFRLAREEADRLEALTKEAGKDIIKGTKYEVPMAETGKAQIEPGEKVASPRSEIEQWLAEDPTRLDLNELIALKNWANRTPIREDRPYLVARVLEKIEEINRLIAEKKSEAQPPPEIPEPIIVGGPLGVTEEAPPEEVEEVVVPDVEPPNAQTGEVVEIPPTDEAPEETPPVPEPMPEVKREERVADQAPEASAEVVQQESGWTENDEQLLRSLLAEKAKDDRVIAEVGTRIEEIERRLAELEAAEAAAPPQPPPEPEAREQAPTKSSDELYKEAELLYEEYIKAFDLQEKEYTALENLQGQRDEIDLLQIIISKKARARAKELEVKILAQQEECRALRADTAKRLSIHEDKMNEYREAREKEMRAREDERERRKAEERERKEARAREERERKEAIEADKEKNPFKYFLMSKMRDEVFRLIFGRDKGEVSLEELNKILGESGKEATYWDCSRIDPWRHNTVHFTSNGFSLQLQNRDEVQGEKGIVKDDSRAKYKLVSPDWKHFNEETELSYQVGRRLMGQRATEYQARLISEFEGQQK